MSCTYQHFNTTRKNLKRDFSYIEMLISKPTFVIMFYEKSVQSLGGSIALRYGNKNLNDNEVQTILKMLSSKESFKSLDIEIYNLTGTSVFQKKNIIDGLSVLNLSQLRGGVHFVKFSSSGISSTKKIIVN